MNNFLAALTWGDLKNTAAACSKTSTLTMINKRAFEELN